jgi:excisionase family DNA binding protein
MQPAATNAADRPQGRGRFLRVREVAERLDVDKALVYRLVQSGQLRAHQLGGKGCTVRIAEDDFERWLGERGEDA